MVFVYFVTNNGLLSYTNTTYTFEPQLKKTIEPIKLRFVPANVHYDASENPAQD
jgi:hypothetical protein